MNRQNKPKMRASLETRQTMTLRTFHSLLLRWNLASHRRLFRLPRSVRLLGLDLAVRPVHPLAVVRLPSLAAGARPLEATGRAPCRVDVNRLSSPLASQQDSTRPAQCRNRRATHQVRATAATAVTRRSLRPTVQRHKFFRPSVPRLLCREGERPRQLVHPSHRANLDHRFPKSTASSPSLVARLLTFSSTPWTCQQTTGRLCPGARSVVPDSPRTAVRRASPCSRRERSVSTCLLFDY